MCKITNKKGVPKKHLTWYITMPSHLPISSVCPRGMNSPYNFLNVSHTNPPMLSWCLPAYIYKQKTKRVKYDIKKPQAVQKEQEWDMHITSIAKGKVVVPYRCITSPFLFTRNLVKFHLMLCPKYGDLLLAFKNLYRGAAVCPFTRT